MTKKPKSIVSVSKLTLGLMALCLFLPGLQSTAAHADGLTWAQRGELFMNGTVTNPTTHQTWNIILVPGINNINHDAEDCLKEIAPEEAKLATSEFWDEVGDNAKDGILFSKDVLKNQWLGGIKSDFHEAVDENQSIQPGAIGSGFERVASWAWFGIKLIARSIWAPIGAAGGVAYSGIAPAVMVTGQTAGVIAWDGGIRGAAVPAVLYVWNGVAWVGDSVGNVPTKESFFVTLEYQDPSTGQPTKLVIDERGFNTLVEASVLEAMTDAQRAQLQAQIDATEAKIQPLQQQVSNLSNQQDQASQNLENSPTQQQLEQLLSQAEQSSQVTLSPDAQNAYMDQNKLHDVITAYLKSLGVASPDPQLVDSIAQRITQTLKQMNAQMKQENSNPSGSPAPAAPAPASQKLN